ncbi:MAG: hypothetical protein IH841_08035, partial [Thaumarchaeota archaeon]|nr:hypothetical protein [Nitrososphaerota archaeon]
FDSALKINSKHVRALKGKAIMLEILGKEKDAIRLYDKLLEIDNDSEPFLKKKFAQLLKNRSKKLP